MRSQFGTKYRFFEYFGALSKNFVKILSKIPRPIGIKINENVQLKQGNPGEKAERTLFIRVQQQKKIKNKRDGMRVRTRERKSPHDKACQANKSCNHFLSRLENLLEKRLLFALSVFGFGSLILECRYSLKRVGHLHR